MIRGRIERAQAAALIIVGLTVTVLGAMAAIQLNGGPMTLPLSESYNEAAEHAVATDPARARALSVEALGLRPVDAESWLRLARLEAGGSKALSASARSALDHSYSVGPYSSSVLESRVEFAFDHWLEIGPDLQGQAISEVKAAWPIEQQRTRLLEVVSRVDNVAGSISLSSLLLELKLSEGLQKSAGLGQGSPAHANRRPGGRDSNQAPDVVSRHSDLAKPDATIQSATYA